MNKIIYYMAFIISSFSFIGCGHLPNPTRKEMIGRWVGKNGAEVEINANGTFVGHHLSFKSFFTFIKPQDSLVTEFDGKGKWKIKRYGPYQAVMLNFDTVSIPGYLTDFPLLIAGKKGFFENKPPWYLYYWVNEEGGDRFRFLKK